MDELKIYYVYFLRRPDYYDPFHIWLWQPFYVGKGFNGRVFVHRKYAKRILNRKDKKRLVYAMIHNLWKRNLDFIEEIMFDNLTEREAFEIEREMIAKYGRIDLGTGCLTNHTDGGDGVSGWEPSEKQRIEMSKRMSGENHRNYGKHWPEEVRSKMSEAKIGEPLSEDHKKTLSENHADVSGENNPFYNKKHTEESKEKMSNSHKGKQHSEETKKKISENHEDRTGEKHPRYGGSWVFNPEENKSKLIKKEEVESFLNHNSKWVRGRKIKS